MTLFDLAAGCFVTYDGEWRLAKPEEVAELLDRGYSSDEFASHDRVAAGVAAGLLTVKPYVETDG